MDKKVGIIYNENGNNSWDINYFKELFEEKGVGVVLFDSNKLGDYFSDFREGPVNGLGEIEKIVNQGYSVWMNRVYPSEAGKSTINKSLNIVSWLNQNGLPTINPLKTGFADYDKFFSYQQMKKEGVPTPYTERITPETSLDYVLDNFSLPLVIKRKTGGKGIGVMKIDSRDSLEEHLSDKNINSGDYIIQEFAKPSEDHDIRVGVIGGEPLISYGRTLVKNNGDSFWMGSYNHGSEIVPYRASEEECRVAVLASKSIDATLNEVDIQLTEKGPVVIENNPTPGYDRGEEHWIRLISDHIYDKYIK